MQAPLTVGALYHVVTSHPAEQKIVISGVFQVLDLKVLASKGDGPQRQRMRMRIGDGQYWLETMLSSQLVEAVNTGEIVQGGIVQVTEFILNQVHDKKIYIALNCHMLEQYGRHTAPIVVPPHTELADCLKIAKQQDEQASHPPPHQQQQQQYGGPPPGGMYGEPPPPANGGYNNQGGYQQGPPPGGLYGGPPPPVNAGGAPPYGAPPPAYGSGPPGAYGGANQQQQQQGGGGGMYGGPPPPAHGGPGAGYGGPGGGAPQQAQGGGYNAYPGAGPAGGARLPPQYQAQGAIVRDEAAPRIMPISALNPYTARWAIRGRVTSKGELRRWTNVKGEGKVFSFDLLDRDGGEIRATAFGAEAEKFNEIIEMGGIYQVTKASLTNKRPQFNHLNHAYEIKLDRSSVVERVPEDSETAQIPAIMYNFRRISELEGTEAGAMLDIIGLVETCDNWQTITRRNGEETQKRSMVVRDDSGRSIEVTLWGALVHSPGDQIEQMVRAGSRPVLAAKALRVGDFNGKTLSTVGASNLRIDPMDLPEGQRLRAWYDGGGRTQAVSALSAAGGGGGGKSDRRTTFKAIKDEHLGTSGKPDWVSVSAVLDMIKIPDNHSNPSAVAYPACPHDFNGRPCQKKMMDIGGGNWNCERCNKSCDAPVWRYMVNVSACDHVGKQALFAFGDAGDAIFGQTAETVRAMEEANPRDFEALTESIRFTQMVFRLKVAEDTYNDEVRLKVSIYRVERLTDFVKEAGVMLSYIAALEAGKPVLVAGGPGGGAAAAAAGGGAGGGGGGYQHGGAAPPAGPTQYGGGGGGMYGGGGRQQHQQQQQQATNPYVAPPATNPYGAPPGGYSAQAPPNTPPAHGGGMYAAPPAAGGYQQGGGGGGGGGSGDRAGPGMYGGPPQQQQQGGYGGGGYASNGGGGAGGYGGGGYAPPQGPGGGGGWNGGPPQQQQQQAGGYVQGGPPQGGGGGGGQGMYGGPPPQQQAGGGYQAPPNAFW